MKDRSINFSRPAARRKSAILTRSRVDDPARPGPAPLRERETSQAGSRQGRPGARDDRCSSGGGNLRICSFARSSIHSYAPSFFRWFVRMREPGEQASKQRRPKPSALKCRSSNRLQAHERGRCRPDPPASDGRFEVLSRPSSPYQQTDMRITDYRRRNEQRTTLCVAPERFQGLGRGGEVARDGGHLVAPMVGRYCLGIFL